MRKEKNQGPKGHSGRMTTPSYIARMAKTALSMAEDLTAQARANRREANIIVRKTVELAAKIERIMMEMSGGTVCVTLRRVHAGPVVTKGDFSGRRRRRNRRGAKSLTAKVCGNVQLFGRPKHRATV
jgi:hypothetical protein